MLNFCWFIGIIFVFKVIYKLVRSARLHFARRISDIDFQAKYGKDSYVLITGSSDGIGKEFAYFFASKGMNLILWSRTMSKLEKIKAELSQKYPSIDIKVISSDFSNSHQQNYFDDNMHSIKDLDISMLVNNVGYLKHPSPAGENLQFMKNSINVNLIPQAVLTSVLMTNMKERKQHSSIINLSSVATSTPIKLLQIYGSTKRFNDYFSRSVENSYSTDNFDHICVYPSPVTTEMGIVGTNGMDKSSSILKKLASTTFVSSQACVEGTIKQLGVNSQTGGAIYHTVLKVVAEIGSTFDVLIYTVTAMFRSARTVLK
jgi:short-subunit dehydrogenase